MDSFPRFTFGWENLMMGIDFLPIAMGFFGVSEILNIAIDKYVATGGRARSACANCTRRGKKPGVPSARFCGAPFWGFSSDFCRGRAPCISTFVAYSLEKKISKTPEKFGTGELEGVVAPEAANNSAVMGAMIPLLTLGIPFAAPSAVMLAGLRMHNIELGPMLFTNRRRCSGPLSRPCTSAT